MRLLAMRSRAAYLVAKQAVQQLARGGAAHLYPQAHGSHKLLSICATRTCGLNLMQGVRVPAWRPCRPVVQPLPFCRCQHAPVKHVCHQRTWTVGERAAAAAARIISV